MKRSRVTLLVSGCCAAALALGAVNVCAEDGAKRPELRIRVQGDRIVVFRAGQQQPLAVQNAREGFRPYLHPIVTPDGKGVLTECSPPHHKHQTGLYLGAHARRRPGLFPSSGR